MKKIVHLYFLLFISIFVLPSIAHAAIGITSVTLNSSTSVTVSGNTTISAKINIITTNNTNWRSTSWRIGNSGNYACVNHTNHNGNGSYTETFNITAPSTAGTYSASFIASSNDSCSGTTNTYTLNNAVTVLPTFSIADASLTEGNSGTSYMNFTVSLSSSAAATVNYTTSNSTATAGSDYTAKTGSLTFISGGTTTQTISIPIIGDTTIESDETFYVTLSNASNASISTATATGTILNDDNPTVSVGEREFAIRNPSTTRNIKGGLKVIGNTVLCVQNNGVCYDYTGGSSNSELNLQYIDIDGITRNYNNSSQAQLTIPTTATIKWAGLYSQGYLNTYNSTSVATTLKDPIYVTIPNIGTISSIPEVIDLYANSNDGYTYDTFAPLPSLIGQTGATVNGWITGANIKANTGTEGSGLGNYGAWTLVVVYEDSSSSLKNISVYDGYKRVANATGFNTVNITPSGFLTPTSGEVKSTLSLFVGEGDKNIVGDKLYIDGTAINNTNAFYSTMSGFTANPSYSNTQGIDIQNHDIGVDGNTSHLQIIGNSKTSATITLTSTQDTYFPSMVAFTTELYEPRVCYVEAYYTEDGNTTLTSANVGDIITIKTWIANMKKDASDGNLETAEKVEITMEHDDTNLAYQSESTKIQNVGESAYSSKTDASDSDIATFTSDTNTSVWHIGTGANATNGGDLTPNVTNDAANKAYISFKEKIQTSGDITIANIYKVSYENSSMGLRIGDESPVNIGVCKDFNASIAVSAPLGVFNVVNQNFTGTTDPKDTTSSLNALYTQIAGKAFNVKVLALDSDYITLKSYTGDVNLSLVTTPNYLASETDDQKQAKCNAATSLTDAKTISFANENSKTVTLDDYIKAYKDVTFKITYDNNGTISYVCSRDNFSIRPEGYSIDLNETKLIGGKQYLFDFNATRYANPPNDSNVSGYNQIIPQSIDQNVSEGLAPLFFPATCIGLNTDRTIATPAVTFTEGSNKTTRYTFNNVGKVLISIDDKLWTKVDQSAYNSKGYSDCIVNSSSNTANNGQIGCTISGSQTFTFVPKQFNNELTLKNFNDGNFTYLSNDGNMSAILRLTTTAILDNNATATFYTAGCYAEDVNYTISVRNFNLFNNTARNLIHYFKDENDTTSILVNNLVAGEGNFSSTEGNFTNGIAQNLKMLFNFDRNSTQAHDPFKIAKSDFNITAIIDDQNTTGSDFNRTTDQNATFYYGRVYSTDYRGTSPIDTTIRYEVYCKDCNRTDMNITGMQSPTSVIWYQNIMHDSLTDGNVTAFASVTVGANATAINPAATPNNGITDGMENHNNHLTNANAPYTDRIQMTPSSWLLYNQYNAGATTNDFTVEFIRAGNWAGQGDLGRTVDVNTSIRTNRRMEW